MKNPCFCCKNRRAPNEIDDGFHSDCELYAEYVAKNEQQKEAYRKWKQEDTIANAYAKETHSRIRRAKEGKRK